MSVDTTHIPVDLSLEGLKTVISPEQIAYYSEWGSIGLQSREVCRTIWTVRDADVLKALLEHSKTLRAPQGKEFPIARIRSAIMWRLAELGV